MVPVQYFSNALGVPAANLRCFASPLSKLSSILHAVLIKAIPHQPKEWLDLAGGALGVPKSKSYKRILGTAQPLIN